MKIAEEHAFLTTFVEHLAPAPAWVQEEPAACGVWLDAQCKLNTCRVRDYLSGSPLVRIAINQGSDLLSNRQPQQGPAWVPVNHTRPDWRLDLTCLAEEQAFFAAWLAAVANRRDGQLHRLPAPPFALLNWSDPVRLEDHLYHLSAVSIWSENAFTADLRSRRRQAARAGDRGLVVAMPLAG